MAQVGLPQAWTFVAAALRSLDLALVGATVLLGTGCASWRTGLPEPPEIAPNGVAARVLLPPDLDVNPPESAKPSAEPMASPGRRLELTTFTLADAIALGLRNNPRLRSARAAIVRSQGQEQVAFAPFLPQVDLLGQYGVVSSTLAPGIPGDEGFLLPGAMGTRNYVQTEVGLEWTLYDFGRTGGRYRQAVARERITELELARADQTVEFDVATAYLGVLLAHSNT